MRLAIDASNIRGGGGITHLVHLLQEADPQAHGFAAVVVWACAATLKQLPERDWLVKRHDPALESSYLRRALWQRRRLGVLLRAERCDLLFAPGGSIGTDFRPVVSMSRNMLPFEPGERGRYGWSATGIRLRLLSWSQRRSFRKSSGVIFLTRYAQEKVLAAVGSLRGTLSIIPHGLDAQFFQDERPQEPLEAYSEARPLRVVYVSIVDLYKHQWHVAEAVSQLRREGMPVALELIGPSYAPAFRKLSHVIQQRDPEQAFLHYTGPTRHELLPARYAAADLCVFASSCENMPNILLEAMAAALPIACSDRGPMPEVLGEGGVYFDPESPESIANALRELIRAPALRASKARVAAARAHQYSWMRCARETFGFLSTIAGARMIA